jgi:type II secretory pathway predicted ATPase ExeA
MQLHGKNLLATFSLKWNPFSQEIPVEGIVKKDEVDRFIWRVENLVMDGGFALVTGAPGSGKSVVMRSIDERLSALRDIKVGVLTRPQSSLRDFYRELGHIYGVDFNMSNRFGGYNQLRAKWVHHLESTLFRPILLIDEAQEMPEVTLNELRLLSSVNLDSKSILTVILSGDERLPARFRLPELQPIGSRIKTRLVMRTQSKEDLAAFMRSILTLAGNPKLMTEGLIKTLAEHSAGNYRTIMTLANELLVEAAANDISKLNEDLYLKVFSKHQ